MRYVSAVVKLTPNVPKIKRLWIVLIKVPLSLLVDMQCTAIVWNWPGCSCTLVFTVVKITRRLEAPTLEHLLRLSCGLHVGLDILIYFRKARDKHFLNSNELIAFFFKQYFKPYFFSNYLALAKQARRFLLKNSGKVLCPSEHVYISERIQPLLYRWRSVRIPHQFSLHNQWPRSLSKWRSSSKLNLLIARELRGSTATSVFSPCADSISTFKSTHWRVKGGAQLTTLMCTCLESFAPPSKAAISLIL